MSDDRRYPCFVDLIHGPRHGQSVAAWVPVLRNCAVRVDGVWYAGHSLITDLANPRFFYVDAVPAGYVVCPLFLDNVLGPGVRRKLPVRGGADDGRVAEVLVEPGVREALLWCRVRRGYYRIAAALEFLGYTPPTAGVEVTVLSITPPLEVPND